MIELRQILQDYLKSKHPNVTINGKSYSRVHYEEAPDKAPYPYLVYDFVNDNDDGETQSVVVVDVDGWDAPKDGDTTALETLMAAINGDGDIEDPTGLNKRTLTTDNLVVTFYLDTKLSLRDNDKRIRRRKYVYQAKVFKI